MTRPRADLLEGRLVQGRLDQLDIAVGLALAVGPADDATVAHGAYGEALCVGIHIMARR